MRKLWNKMNMSSVASARTASTACSATLFAVRFFAYCFFYYFTYFFKAIEDQKGIRARFRGCRYHI